MSCRTVFLASGFSFDCRAKGGANKPGFRKFPIKTCSSVPFSYGRSAAGSEDGRRVDGNAVEELSFVLTGDGVSNEAAAIGRQNSKSSNEGSFLGTERYVLLKSILILTS